METFSAWLALCAGNSPVPVNSPHKGQWRGALMFSLIYVWINDWANNREAGDLRRYRGHFDVIVMRHNPSDDAHIQHFLIMTLTNEKWKRFPQHWPFVWGIHWSLVDPPHNEPVMQRKACPWHASICLLWIKFNNLSNSDPTPFFTITQSFGRKLTISFCGCLFSCNAP